MSDIKAHLQGIDTPEQQELSELAVRKDLHRSETAPANAADLHSDLAAASISQKDVIRVTPNPDIASGVRRFRASPLTTVDLWDGRSRSSSRLTNPSATLTSTRKADAKSAERGPNGIFKNPRFSYEGGLLNKIFSLLSNMIQVLVQFLLRLLGARDTVAPTPVPQHTQKKEGNNGSNPNENQERERIERKKRRDQTTQLT